MSQVFTPRQTPEFGVPDVIRSDNGSPFNSKEFAAFADDLGFKH